MICPKTRPVLDQHPCAGRAGTGPPVAPAGWKWRVGHRLRDMYFISPYGYHIRSRKDLSRYLKTLDGPPTEDQFCWKVTAKVLGDKAPPSAPLPIRPPPQSTDLSGGVFASLLSSPAKEQTLNVEEALPGQHSSTNGTVPGDRNDAPSSEMEQPQPPPGVGVESNVLQPILPSAQLSPETQFRAPVVVGNQLPVPDHESLEMKLPLKDNEEKKCSPESNAAETLLACVSNGVGKVGSMERSTEATPPLADHGFQFVFKAEEKAHSCVDATKSSSHLQDAAPKNMAEKSVGPNCANEISDPIPAVGLQSGQDNGRSQLPSSFTDASNDLTSLRCFCKVCRSVSSFCRGCMCCFCEKKLQPKGESTLESTIIVCLCDHVCHIHCAMEKESPTCPSCLQKLDLSARVYGQSFKDCPHSHTPFLEHLSEDQRKEYLEKKEQHTRKQMEAGVAKVHEAANSSTFSETPKSGREASASLDVSFDLDDLQEFQAKRVQEELSVLNEKSKESRAGMFGKLLEFDDEFGRWLENILEQRRKVQLEMASLEHIKRIRRTR